MPRARKQPSLAPLPVEFVETKAQNAGTTIELIDRGKGRSPEKRRRRYHMLDRLAKFIDYGKGRTSPARITQRQCDAGFKLLDAWCETELSPSMAHEFVDKSVDWDGIALANAQRSAAWASVSRFLPARHRDVVLTVVIHQIPVEDMDGLRAGLDAVADGLRLP